MDAFSTHPIPAWRYTKKLLVLKSVMDIGWIPGSAMAHYVIFNKSLPLCLRFLIHKTQILMPSDSHFKVQGSYIKILNSGTLEKYWKCQCENDEA